MNNECEGYGITPLLNNLSFLYRYVCGGNEENHEKPHSVRIGVGISTTINLELLESSFCSVIGLEAYLASEWSEVISSDKPCERLYYNILYR
jgi:hypothetical protein